MEEFTSVPPDGGWGWLVLFGATLVNILVPGTIKSFGVLFVEFLEVFDATPSTAAWIPALCYFLYSSLGPISSILSLKYSYKAVTFVGGTSAALGMVLSFFAQSIVHLYLSYGILVGIGAGLSFPPTVYIVTTYFVKRRGVANGICISGSAFGSIILPPLLRFLLERYGYRGAVLLMGGITFHCWVAALFYDPVEKHMVKVLKKQIVAEDEESAFLPENPKFRISTEDDSTSMYQLDENEKGYSGCEQKINPSPVCNELLRVQSGSTRYQLTGSTTLYPVPETSKDLENLMPNTVCSTNRFQCTAPHHSRSTCPFQYISTPYHGSTLTLSPEIIASTFSLKTGGYVKTKKQNQCSPAKTKLFDVSIFKDPLYLTILISNSTNAISYTNFIILLPSYAQTLGFDKNKGALLLSIVSAFDLVGRIGGSALSDITHFPKKWYYICGLLFSGISLAILPFAPTYNTLSIVCATFGLASGCYVGITAVIMADLLGSEKIQSSYGTSLFVNGVLQLIGPPLCGIWFQSSKSFAPIFCTLGIILIIGSSLWGIVPLINKRPNNTDNGINSKESI